MGGTSVGIRWLDALNRRLDFFVPAAMAAERERHDCARMFLVSHAFGPILGNSIPLFLLMAGFPMDYRLIGLFVLITSFWIFPFALRATGKYELLVVLSVEILIATIFWGCFYYGGLNSPFLPWVLAIPLLAFFYVGRARWMIWALPLQLLANLAAFSLLYAAEGGFPTIDLRDLHGIGLLSTVSASCYVSMMAIYYANVLYSSTVLEKEVHEHLLTAASLQRAVARAERAGSAKSEFVASMSHELRTPLNAVIGYSQLVIEEAAEDLSPAVTSDLVRIKNAGLNLLELVNDILDFSRIDAGKMEVMREPVLVAQIVTDCVNRMRARLEENGNTVLLSCGSGLGEAYFDVGLTMRALDQVLDNAGKFTVGGSIAVSAERVEGPGGASIRIHVRDTGVGIDKIKLQLIFDHFVSSKDESNTSYGGATIGLALTRSICNLLGGGISASSEPGVGSHFIIELPVARPLQDGCDLAAAA